MESELKSGEIEFRGNFHSGPSDQAEKTTETDRCKYNLSEKQHSACAWMLPRKLPVISGSFWIKWTGQISSGQRLPGIELDRCNLIKVKSFN